MKARDSATLALLLFSLCGCAHSGRIPTAANATQASRPRAGTEVKWQPVVVDVSTLKGLADVIANVADKKIVYVGEVHDKFAHHRVQLRILEGLYQQHPRLAIGMEMFQKPFQKALDDFISGAIDERAFLKQSEYFKRWDMDYNLYKPILDFARERGIPVVALNLQRELVNKVSANGLDSLSANEKLQIPQELDFADQAYRARLEEVFRAHPNSGRRNFEFFYQSQILWDETMAESIDQFLKSNPDFRMGIIAGAGHLQYGSGIPKRSFRRNGLTYAIVLNDSEVQTRIGDFIVFPEPLEGPRSARLMALLDEQNQSVRITGFAKDSVAEKAGLKKGDIILALENEPVKGIDDVKIALFFKRPGDMIKVKVRRTDGSASTKELEYRVTLL